MVGCGLACPGGRGASSGRGGGGTGARIRDLGVSSRVLGKGCGSYIYGCGSKQTGGARRGCWSVLSLTRATHFGIPVF